MAKQGFNKIGHFNLATNDSPGTNTGGRVTKSYSGTGGDERFITDNGAASTYLGIQAGPDIVTLGTAGRNNVGIGFRALQVIDTSTGGNADDNVAIGSNACVALTTGTRNVVVNCGTRLTTGSSNVMIGFNAGEIAATSGLITGTQNVLIGTGAGAQYTNAESSNVMINNGGVAGEDNTCRIGTGTGTSAQQLNRTFIAGIRGITTAVNDAVAVLVDSANQLGTVSSSLRYKTNVHDIGSQSEVIYLLKPKAFEMRSHPGIPDWGLIAEEVDEVFPQICVYKDGEPETVQYHRLVPLLLNEIQKLRKEVDELKAK